MLRREQALGGWWYLDGFHLGFAALPTCWSLTGLLSSLTTSVDVVLLAVCYQRWIMMLHIGRVTKLSKA